MKKRIEKPKAKPVADKNGAVRKELPRRAAEASVSADPLRNLLRGTYTNRACER
jgi:hypothetical protein